MTRFPDWTLAIAVLVGIAAIVMLAGIDGRGWWQPAAQACPAGRSRRDIINHAAPKTSFTMTRANESTDMQRAAIAIVPDL